MAFNRRIALCFLILSGLFLNSDLLFGSGHNLPDPIEIEETTTDTIPITDRYGDYINDDQYNPFDILPSNVEQTVEYDPESGNYLIIEKIGDEYYRAPSYLTFEEYLEWRSKQQEREYFDKISGISSEYKSGSGKIDPLSKINIEKNLLDRLFGGNEITIEPQGNIDLTFGLTHNNTEAINRPISANRYTLFDFDMDIKMNVEGKIGDKMNLGFNYDTNASFDFDRKIKLEYDSEQFSEDDIIKKIEAGNVSLPLRSSLIQGAQSLFGIKMETQWGKLRLTGIASQQRSRQESLSVQNGATFQEFEIRPDDYDENRHFFISHYHRDAYEDALSNLPYINSKFRVTNIEVWISDDRPDYQQNQTMILAVADIAENDESRFSNQSMGRRYEPATQAQLQTANLVANTSSGQVILPDNRGNDLFQRLTDHPDVQRIEFTSSTLKSSAFGMSQPNDFEVFRGRKLSSSEYAFNPELGFISLNVRLQPNQILSISYEYFYTENCDEVYKVGSITDEGSVPNSNVRGEVESEGVIFTKMLKSSNQKVSHPTWDLMMKNVYPLRTNQLNQADFKFDVFYEDDTDGSLKKFLPEEGFSNIPLLNIFQLDRLNSRNDPQPDGVFDFVPGVTVVPQNGAIIFPVLEPFGSSLEELIGDPAIASKYQYQALYDTTVTIARENLVQNKFVMVGEYKSTVSSEYSLGAWNIPQGSVTVRAGGQVLMEGVDYEVDYGIGRVRIINESYLQQGTPINISYEDNSLFSLQQKTMLGLRAEYEVNENFYVGATYMRLFERPFTEKVNIGDDPINNRVFGMDMDFSQETPVITKIVDKLPFYSTSEPSVVNFTAEVAALKPGHSGAVNLDGTDDNSGVVSIDDFEGAVSGFPFNSFGDNRWILASVPDYVDDNTRFPEAEFTDLRSGYNRAKLSWHTSDRSEQVSEGGKDHSYTRLINQQELFNRQLPQGTLPYLFTFDLNYYPDERGPYNFDPPNGHPGISAGIGYDVQQQKVFLKEPETRWAGIMRYMPNSDFQAANYEFIEFWLLNPFLDQTDGSMAPPDEEGFITFHLGNVSEDILHDNLQFFENSIPTPEEEAPRKETEWGNVPLTRPTNAAFDQEFQQQQDLGLDGLDDDQERAKFEDYIDEVSRELSLPPQIINDPSADNFVSYNDFDVFSQDDDLLLRYKHFNNPQGNSPILNQVDRNQPFQRGNPSPDKEDLNENYSLDQGESFYEYKIPIKNMGGEIDISENQFITQDTVIINPNNSVDEKWYRFRIPLSEGAAINGIEGFRSIQFVRMLVNGFSTHKTFRMAEFELIRNQWRRLPGICLPDGGAFQGDFSVDAVGIEENQSKKPFGYVLPRGIKQQRVFSTFSNVLQDEKSLALRYCDLTSDCGVSIYKLTELDLRVFEKLQMFVHAESRNDEQQDGDVGLYLRVGKDFDRHYYEYEIPLKLSTKDSIDEPSTSEKVWPEENMLNFALDLFIQAKKIRNVEGGSTTQDFVLDNTWITENIDRLDAEFKSIFIDTLEGGGGRYLPEGHKIKVRGNPNLGLIKGIQIGLRNISERADTPPEGFCGEVWVNELRVTGLLERGGLAGLARLDVQLADLGNFSASGSYSSLGWGALDQKVNERAKEEVIEYDFASNLELGKFFPDHWGLRIPFYAQYSKQIINPEFDAYDFDITVEDERDLVKNLDPTETDTINQRNQTVRTIRTFNLTNVRKERTSGKAKAVKAAPPPNKNAVPGMSQPPGNNQAQKGPRKPMPWDIENLSLSYSFTEVNYRDPILKADNSKDYRLGLDYNYTRRAGYIQPFKKLKPKALALIREINLNPIPNSFTFSSNINRFISTRVFRIPETPRFEFDDRRFNWERRYDVNWNLTKGIKINYSAFNESYIDELRQTGIVDKVWLDENGRTENANGEAYSDLIDSDPNFAKSYWKQNLRDLGRNTNYSQNVSVNYTLPMKYIPFMDWIDIKAQYRADYNWAAGPLIEIDGEINPIGNVIQNGQNRSLNASFNFDRLYNKSKYLKNLDKIKSDKRKTRLRTPNNDLETRDKETDSNSRNSRKKEKEPSRAEKLLIRPLFMLRSVRFNYKEDFVTIIPGFMDTPQYFGLADGLSSPGFGFAFGAQPDISKDNPNNWLQDAANNKNWISRSSALNQPVVQTKAQTLDAKIKIEPWKDFKIDLDFSKNYRTNHSEEFRYKKEPTDSIASFKQFGLRDMGSFELTYYTLNTLFGKDINELFEQFESYRSIISYRLPNEGGDSHSVDGVEYANGYGKQSSTVVVPAFLAAYTDQDPNTISLDLEGDVRSLGYVPKPNWKLRYDGLTKLPWFKDKFSSFTLEHGYSSKLRINSFASDVEYDISDPYSDTKINGNYYARLEIPFVQINEQFNPIIGLKIKTKQDMNLEFSYIKSRLLDLSINTSSELTETKKTEFVFGFGYTIKDSKFLKKKKKTRGSRSRQKDDEDLSQDDPLDRQSGRNSRRSNVSSTRGSDMTFLLNFGFSDNVTFVHRLDFGGTPDRSRGLKTLTISPSMDYIVNDNLTVRVFVDYNATRPYISTNPPVTNIEGGVTMRMTLN